MAGGKHDILCNRIAVERDIVPPSSRPEGNDTISTASDQVFLQDVGEDARCFRIISCYFVLGSPVYGRDITRFLHTLRHDGALGVEQVGVCLVSHCIIHSTDTR